MAERKEGEINPVQALQFELLKHASFDSLDGEQIAQDLQDQRYRSLWRGMVTGGVYDLVCLRDIDEGYWNTRRLHLLSSGVDDDKLELLARSWGGEPVWLAQECAEDLLGSRPLRSRVLMVDWSAT